MSSSEQALPPHTSLAQQRVVHRIHVQRERLRASRAARLQSVALASEAGAEAANAPLLLRAAVLARQHPAAVAALAGLAMMTGPRRLLRWAGVVLPLLASLRR